MNQAQCVRGGPVCLSPDSLAGLGRGLSGVSARSRVAAGGLTSTRLDPQRRALGSDLLKPVPALSPAHGFLPLVTPSLLSLQITGKKPNFEVGSSSQLKLSIAKKSSGEMA